MARYNKYFAEMIYNEEKDLLSYEAPEPQELEISYSPEWVVREFVAYTRYGHPSLYRMGVRLSDMSYHQEMVWGLYPTNASFEEAWRRAWKSLISEVSERYTSQMQNILNWRFRRLKVHCYWSWGGKPEFTGLGDDWLGDILLREALLKQIPGKACLLDLRGCRLRDLLRNNGELLGILMNESRAFSQGICSSRKGALSSLKESENSAKDAEVYDCYLKRDLEKYSPKPFIGPIPEWAAKIKTNQCWCSDFLKSVNPKLFDISNEDLENILQHTTANSLVEAYKLPLQSKEYSRRVRVFIEELNKLM